MRRPTRERICRCSAETGSSAAFRLNSSDTWTHTQHHGRRKSAAETRSAPTTHTQTNERSKQTRHVNRRRGKEGGTRKISSDNGRAGREGAVASVNVVYFGYISPVGTPRIIGGVGMRDSLCRAHERGCVSYQSTKSTKNRPGDKVHRRRIGGG